MQWRPGVKRRARTAGGGRRGERGDLFDLDLEHQGSASAGGNAPLNRIGPLLGSDLTRGTLAGLSRRHDAGAGPVVGGGGGAPRAGRTGKGARRRRCCREPQPPSYASVQCTQDWCGRTTRGRGAAEPGAAAVHEAASSQPAAACVDEARARVSGLDRRRRLSGPCGRRIVVAENLVARLACISAAAAATTTISTTPTTVFSFLVFLSFVPGAHGPPPVSGPRPAPDNRCGNPRGEAGGGPRSPLASTAACGASGPRGGCHRVPRC